MSMSAIPQFQIQRHIRLIGNHLQAALPADCTATGATGSVTDLGQPVPCVGRTLGWHVSYATHVFWVTVALLWLAH
jgi:hypothetical protein